MNAPQKTNAEPNESFLDSLVKQLERLKYVFVGQVLVYGLFYQARLLDHFGLHQFAPTSWDDYLSAAFSEPVLIWCALILDAALLAIFLLHERIQKGWLGGKHWTRHALLLVGVALAVALIAHLFTWSSFISVAPDFSFVTSTASLTMACVGALAIAYFEPRLLAVLIFFVSLRFPAILADVRIARIEASMTTGNLDTTIPKVDIEIRSTMSKPALIPIASNANYSFFVDSNVTRQESKTETVAAAVTKNPREAKKQTTAKLSSSKGIAVPTGDISLVLPHPPKDDNEENQPFPEPSNEIEEQLKNVTDTLLRLEDRIREWPKNINVEVTNVPPAAVARPEEGDRDASQFSSIIKSMKDGFGSVTSMLNEGSITKDEISAKLDKILQRRDNESLRSHFTDAYVSYFGREWKDAIKSVSLARTAAPRLKAVHLLSAVIHRSNSEYDALQHAKMGFRLPPVAKDEIELLKCLQAGIRVEDWAWLKSHHKQWKQKNETLASQ